MPGFVLRRIRRSLPSRINARYEWKWGLRVAGSGWRSRPAQLALVPQVLRFVPEIPRQDGARRAEVMSTCQVPITVYRTVAKLNPIGAGSISVRACSSLHARLKRKDSDYATVANPLQSCRLFHNLKTIGVQFAQQHVGKMLALVRFDPTGASLPIRIAWQRVRYESRADCGLNNISWIILH